VAAAHQEGHQPAVRGLRRERCEPTRARPGEPGEAVAVVVSGGRLQGLVDQAAVDALGREAGYYGAPALEAAIERVLGEFDREPGVVDQPDVLEPVELGGDLVRIEAGTNQARLQLASGPWANREEPERALVERELAGNHAGQPAVAG
jgi:hypothetical protein